ncbi:MAG: D-aminoacyl-tRNA deacylase [Saprospiraceae bacterium]|nr:D-aminoacyl-tRNA deacylase [Saprospiraceae bacterium]
MRAVIQRVLTSSVIIGGLPKAEIDQGLLILLGIEVSDDDVDLEWLTRKIINLRVFADEHGKMNKSVKDIGGDILLISQFTLCASTKKGNRPSFINAASPEIAKPLYQQMITSLNETLGTEIATGEFAADMKVELVNDGPVTIWMDSKSRE